MGKPHRKIREKARRMFLTSEATTNAEIAARLAVKAHTIGRWRREEDWDGLRLKTDRRAAEKFVEKIATERVTLNLRHYRVWDLVMAKLAETLKVSATLDIKTLEQIAGILDRVQKGQRVAKGLSTSGETEEQIRAEAAAENRALVDSFVEGIKEQVTDPDLRDKIRQAVASRLPGKPDDGEPDAG